MACTSTWDRESNARKGIAGERRADRRYPIMLDLRWKLTHRKRVLETGEGTTVDFSSGGIRFEAGRTMPEGFGVELAIRWPVLLHNVAPMQLVVHGRIIWSEGDQIAIRMIQHEFRTLGTSANHCGAPFKAARTDTPFLAALNAKASVAKIQ